MVGVPQLPSQVRFAGPQQLLSEDRVAHACDGTGGAASAPGRRVPKLGMRGTGLSLSSGMATQPELLEREGELKALDAALAEAAAGRGGVVVVVGEAGIGKSALVAGFAAGL